MSAGRLLAALLPLLLCIPASTVATPVRSTGPNEGGEDNMALISSTTKDMERLNEFIQADKQNEINVESLYADLQARFNAVKQEWVRSETERNAMRHALSEARQKVETLSKQNKHLTDLMRAARLEQRRLSQAKESVMKALAMDDSLDDAIENATVSA